MGIYVCPFTAYQLQREISSYLNSFFFYLQQDLHNQDIVQNLPDLVLYTVQKAEVSASFPDKSKDNSLDTWISITIAFSTHLWNVAILDT